MEEKMEEKRMETPAYIKQLLRPSQNGKQISRKVWSIDLESVWLPFFTATNVTGETAIANEALGAPLRLQYDQSGAVKFSKSGRPVIKVAKEIADQVRLVRENFTATLTHYANSVAIENPQAYKDQIESARRAGEPIINHDKQRLSDAIAELMEKQKAEAEGKKAKAKASVKA